MSRLSRASWLARGWRAAYWLLCAAVFVFLVAPILVIVPLSFNAGAFFTYPLAGVSLQWYREFLTGVQWQRAVENSLIVAVGATAVATSLGTLAALGLHRVRLPFRQAIVAVLLSPMVVPVIITAVGMFYFYARIGITNTLGGLIVAHAALGIPFVFVTVGAVLSTLDDNLVRAAASMPSLAMCLTATLLFRSLSHPLADQSGGGASGSRHALNPSRRAAVPPFV